MTNYNGHQFGRSYGNIASTPASPLGSAASLKPIRSPTSYSSFGVSYGSSNLRHSNDSRRSSVDRGSLNASNTGTDYTPSLSSLSSGRYPSSSLSSRESGSGRFQNHSKPSAVYSRSNSTNLSTQPLPEEQNESGEVSGKYFVAISRACSTEEDPNFRSKITGISATKTEKMERPVEHSHLTNGTQTADDILLPATKGSAGSPTSKINIPRRLNIGGRYLNQLSRQENEPQSPQPGRGGWRESVYGVDYLAKSRAQTQPPSSPLVTATATTHAPATTVTSNLSVAEQRRLERDRMLEEEWKNQIQLEIERERRRLRQLERKAKWEKDEQKNQELEEEIKRRRQVAAELAEKEAHLRAEEQRRKETAVHRGFEPSPSQDPIQKVNDWKRQHSFHDADPPSAGEMSGSQLWDVVEKPSETEAVQLRENAVRTRPHLRRSEASRYSRDSETTIRQDTLTSEPKRNSVLSGLGSRRRSSVLVPGANSYVTQHTDIDDLLTEKFPSAAEDTRGVTKGAIERRDYYADDSGESDGDEVKLVYKSWKSKEIFQKMTTDVQNLLMKSHKRLINVRMLMEVCRNKYHDRRFTDAEEKAFRGYKSANELLTESGVDVKKVSADFANCAA
ncbi:FH1/FH2 domain-containing protein 3 [Fasciola hepatica]|uniref:FH1/FH2 domain-containing protein 3 n=1 Tax=Fasciola hepatica TaxID=6192 RepID=A0A4E0S1N0_FASHE|nr:FH1/FH2 domain-containing protein 3 [Fasciola hepatica]